MHSRATSATEQRRVTKLKERDESRVASSSLVDFSAKVQHEILTITDYKISLPPPPPLTFYRFSFKTIFAPINF